jgi:hypothetical protein
MPQTQGKLRGSGLKSHADFTEITLMPKIRRQGVPPGVFRHLLDRIQLRQIDADQLGLLAEWLDRGPEVPAGRWFRRFPGMTVCGEGELVKTFLTPGQTPVGEELA